MGLSMILRAPSGILPVRNRIATPGRSRIEFAPPRALWRGQMPGQLGSLKVNYETAIADRHGRVEKILQRGSNTITNWGMDQLASLSVASLVNYLVLSSTNDARKRVMSGPTLTVTYTSPTNIAVASDVGFFVSTDAGRTLKLPNVPELKIVTYTNSQNVVCRTPSGDWLPGFAVPGAPTNYSAATIYFTDLSTLATYFTQFNSYDTGGNTLTTDNVNNQFIHERIFLGPTVTGADWTVNQLGWSDGNASHNCFGVANLVSPDAIPIGKKYRVKLDVYSVYTPINLVGVAVNWGATIGNYTMDIRQEYIGQDGGGVQGNILAPLTIGAGSPNSCWWNATHTFVAPYWEGQSGGTLPPNAGRTDTGSGVVQGTYTSGQYKRTKNLKWPDTGAIVNATALGMFYSGASGGYSPFTLKPQSGTVNKPSGYWCDWTFSVYWTRDLPT